MVTNGPESIGDRVVVTVHPSVVIIHPSGVFFLWEKEMTKRGKGNIPNGSLNCDDSRLQSADSRKQECSLFRPSPTRAITSMAPLDGDL